MARGCMDSIDVLKPCTESCYMFWNLHATMFLLLPVPPIISSISLDEEGGKQMVRHLGAFIIISQDYAVSSLEESVIQGKDDQA